ncbi:alpha-galactosidase [Bacillus sp. FJAT-49732]|uniref:Alpha-galactosidase n=1 Tax=Lederbergia citrisecunda TaxID=2833583 RepID=A0A942YN19_9BACI|nr:alpha-galactosidase [Lederbergia citrisecunda]MBS4202129.1 alpha-galactosidase [Lederbergia citrisecunda]
MAKFTFIGAGSLGFTRKLVTDILSFPSLADSTIALMDIDEERLDVVKKVIERIIEKGNFPAKVEATTNRAEALTGADAVICTILVGGVQIFRHDIEIPKKYGVDINVGDTRGPAGIFRALRTIPVMVDIAKDIEKYCPNAYFLNYTNPMTMLSKAVQDTTNVKYVGLCHSVQHTAEMLARWLGAPMDEITYTCSGINHLAFYSEFKWNGEDAYPRLRELMEDPQIYNEEQVRNEMFLHLDYYVTESSGHNSEYNAWFRKRPDLIEKYCTHGTGWNPGEYAYILNEYLDQEQTWKAELRASLEQPVDLTRSTEYASSILNAIMGDGTLFTFNGNIENQGYIDNLPDGSCVEIPILASKRGFDPIKVGSMPEHLAVLANTHARCESLAVEAALTGDKRKVFQAICMDPLTSAVLSLAEIKSMVDELFEINKDWLPTFNQDSKVESGGVTA